MSEMCEEYVKELNQFIEEGDHKALKSFIIEKNIKPDDEFDEFFKSRQQGPNPVCLAVKLGNVAVIKTLLDMGFPENEQYSQTINIHPIHVACKEGNVEVVKLLVEDYGIDITQTDNSYTRPALCVAADHGNVNVLQYFLEKGVSVDLAQGIFGMSPLHAAAQSDQVEVCKFLLLEGADLDLDDFHMHTPLMYAAQKKSHASAKVLMDAGADVTRFNDDTVTAFHVAAQHGDTEMMELLLSYGADPEVVDTFNISPLHAVVNMNFYDQAYYLLNKLNVTVNTPRYYQQLGEGETVCKLALLRRHFDMVRLLINAGYNAYEELAGYENILHEDREELQELAAMFSRPRSLFSLCALTVRRVLGRRLPVDLERLPLPEILRNKIIACSERK